MTLVEGIGMMVLTGILGAIAYPAINGLREAGVGQQAVGLAQALNQAQQTYELRVANAASNWSDAGDSDDRYLLISTYVPFAAASLEQYEPARYTFTLGATLDTKVAITGPNGPVAY